MPKILRKEHKKYVKTMINNYETISLEKNIDFEEIYRQWQQFGEIIKSSKEVNQQSGQACSIRLSLDKIR